MVVNSAVRRAGLVYGEYAEGRKLCHTEGGAG